MSKNKYILCCNLVFTFADMFRALGPWTCLYIWSPYTVGLFMVSKSSFSQWNMRNNHVQMKSLFVVTSETYHLFVILKCPFYGNTYGLLTKCEVKMARYWPSSFYACLWTETKSRSINSQKKNEANIQPSWPNKLGQ